jgi:hypothetical protein
MMRLHVSGIGLAAPGLPDWDAARAAIAGDAPYEPSELLYRPPETLSGAEKRRSPQSVRLALDVAEQARRMAGVDGRDLLAVFASMTGDGVVVTRCLETLADASPYVSPTDFHNTVHNAAAGYWAIGAGSNRPVTSLGAAKETFAMALLKACMEAVMADAPVLLCVYDIPYPDPLRARIRVDAPFGAALILQPAGQGTAPTMTVALADADRPVSRPACGFWDALFDGAPAARAIPLLERLAAAGGSALGDICVGRAGSRALVVAVAP